MRGILCNPQCEGLSAVLTSQIEGRVMATLYHCHLGELSQALWVRASWDTTEQFSRYGEVVIAPIVGDCYRFMKGVRVIWQNIYDNKMMMVGYDVAQSTHILMHKCHPIHHISSLGTGGSGGITHY